MYHHRLGLRFFSVLCLHMWCVDVYVWVCTEQAKWMVWWTHRQSLCKLSNIPHIQCQWPLEMITLNPHTQVYSMRPRASHKTRMNGSKRTHLEVIRLELMTRCVTGKTVQFIATPVVNGIKMCGLHSYLDQNRIHLECIFLEILNTLTHTVTLLSRIV